MPKIKSFLEKDSTGSQDQEDAPSAVRPEGLVPHLVENFEKQIQDQETENTQISTVPVVRKEIESDGTDNFKKILEDFLQEQKEAQCKMIEMHSKFMESQKEIHSKLLELMMKTLEGSQKVFSHKLDHYLQ